MDSPLCPSINGVMWHHPPLCSLQMRASSIKSRLVAAESTDDWSAYRGVNLYFRPAPSEGLNDGHWSRTDVHKTTYNHPDLVHMGRVEVSPYGTFAWKGQYPEYVRSKRLYIVVAVADDGCYAVWGERFGWYSGPRKGSPDRPDGTILAGTLAPVAPERIRPGQYLRRLPVMRSNAQGNIRVFISHVRQYSNCSLISVQLEGPTGGRWRLAVRLTIQGYDCQFSEGRGNRYAADYVFLVTPPIPDAAIPTPAMTVEFESRPLRPNDSAESATIPVLSYPIIARFNRVVRTDGVLP